MIAPFYFIGLSAVLTLYIAPSLSVRLSRGVYLAGIALLGISFSHLYDAVPDVIAQDRSQYFVWYNASAELLQNEDARDRLFVQFLHLLPSGLTTTAFNILFSGLFFTTLATVAVRLTSQYAQSIRHSLGVVLVLCTDRLFWELALNTTRSTWAAILFLGIFATKSRSLQATCLILSFGFHSKAFFALTAALAISLVIRNWLLGIRLLLACGIFAFAYRFATSTGLFSYFGWAVDIILELETQDLARGVAVTGLLTTSLAIQIVAAVVAPSLVMYSRSLRMDSGKSTRSRDRWNFRFDRDVALSFAIACATFSLALYPDFALGLRFMIVPMLILPMFISERYMPLFLLSKALLLLFAVGR